MQTPTFIPESIIFLSLTISVFSIIGFSLSLYTKIKLKKLFRGAEGHDLETVIKSMGDALVSFEKKQEVIDKRLEVMDKKVTKHVRGVGLIRFNPFTDQGGTQSFSLALLNEDKDGVVISSLFARERTSVYAKPISNMSSSFELSDEEKQALDKAVKSM